jgi:hypothetical protein
MTTKKENSLMTTPPRTLSSPLQTMKHHHPAAISSLKQLYSSRDIDKTPPQAITQKEKNSQINSNRTPINQNLVQRKQGEAEGCLQSKRQRQEQIKRYKAGKGKGKATGKISGKGKATRTISGKGKTAGTISGNGGASPPTRLLRLSPPPPVQFLCSSTLLHPATLSASRNAYDADLPIPSPALLPTIYAELWCCSSFS